jgi:hypothetical protein
MPSAAVGTTWALPQNSSRNPRIIIGSLSTRSSNGFLSNGLVQGRPEELHYWEHPADAKARKQVDGLGLLAKFQSHLGEETFHDGKIVGDGKVAIRYGTGYQDPFRYSTVRIEAGIQLLQLPIVFWTQKGYMTDLSQYYRNVRGYGVEIEIGAF